MDSGNFVSLLLPRSNQQGLNHFYKYKERLIRSDIPDESLGFFFIRGESKCVRMVNESDSELKYLDV